MMTGPEDQDVGRLLGLVSSGDPAALEDLLLRNLGGLRAYVRRCLGVRLGRQESATDLVQSVCREVLEDAARGAFAYRGEAEFQSWLRTVALHKIQMRARYWRVRGNQTVDGARSPAVGLERIPAASCDQGTPSAAAVQGEERARLLAALAQIDPRQRELVEWAHIDGLGHREIAVRLGITEAHSRVLLSRALARLARIAAGPRG